MGLTGALAPGEHGLFGGKNTVKRTRRVVWAVSLAGALGGAILGCAPGAKTVANVSIGNTGCPAEDLAVFNYVVENRSWRAVCVEKLYVCSDIRGATQCVPQDPNTEEAGLKDRAKLLLKLDKPRRDVYIKSDIRAGSWESFSSGVVALSKMNAKQVADVEDAMKLITGLSDPLMQQLSACKNAAVLPIRVDKKTGALLPQAGNKNGCFLKLMGSSEFAHLRAHRDETFFVPTGIFGVKPLPAPQAAPPPAPVEAQPVEPPAAPEPNPEIEAAVREWLDGNARAIVSCTGEESAVLVKVDDQGKPQVSLQGALAGKAAEGCVRSALGSKQFPPGPAEVMHFVKKPAKK